MIKFFTYITYTLTNVKMTILMTNHLSGNHFVYTTYNFFEYSKRGQSSKTGSSQSKEMLKSPCNKCYYIYHLGTHLEFSFNKI